MSGLDEQGWKDKNWLIAAFWEDKTRIISRPFIFWGGRYIDTIWKHILVWWVQWPILFAGYLYEIRISCDFDECVNVPIKKDWRPNGMILEDRLLLCKMRSRYQHSWQNHKIWVTCHLFTWETWRCSIRSNVFWWRDDHFRVRSLQLFVFGSNFAGDCVRKMGT